MKHGYVFADARRNKKDEWLKYVENDVLCRAFSYLWFSKAMEDITGFGMKDCLRLLELGWNYFKSI